MELSNDFDYQNVQHCYREKVFLQFRNFEPELKLEQAQIIHAILMKKDTLSLLPTSFGKTLCIVAPSIIEAKVNV
jgi:superfamily II DNA helicase RecQ